MYFPYTVNNPLNTLEQFSKALLIGSPQEAIRAALFNIGQIEQAKIIDVVSVNMASLDLPDSIKRGYAAINDTSRREFGATPLDVNQVQMAYIQYISNVVSGSKKAQAILLPLIQQCLVNQAEENNKIAEKQLALNVSKLTELRHTLRQLIAATPENA